MWGWFNAATARASRSKRSPNRSAETLIATSRPSRVSRALYTSPMPPAPIGTTISYGPRRSRATRGIVLETFYRGDCQLEGTEHVTGMGVRVEYVEYLISEV